MVIISTYLFNNHNPNINIQLIEKRQQINIKETIVGIYPLTLSVYSICVTFNNYTKGFWRYALVYTIRIDTFTVIICDCELLM